MHSTSSRTPPRSDRAHSATTPPETHPTPAKKRKLKPASAIMSAVINQVNREIQTRSPAPSPIKPAEVINPYASLQRRPKQPPPNDPAQAPGESEARKRRLDGWLHPDTPSETRTPPQPPAEAILQQTMPKAYRQDAPARPKRKTGQVGSLPERLLKKQKLREERLRARSPAEPARRSPPTAVPGPPAETERPTKHTPVTAAAPNPSPDAAPPTGPPPTLTLTAPAATPLVRPPLPAAPASPKLTLLSPQQQHAEAPAKPRAAVIATVRALPPHHLRASYDLLRGFCAPRPPAPPGLLGGPGDGPVEHVLARVRAVECPRLPTFLLS
ncbi:hypothetical protein PtA15_14A125 [Puccinia triticina]|uniref:Uncharacterized protein n=1 Tax=Puccinia triticina TaxID=208348 RepID=A0ABY7D3T5_9BASI|nr:uncharacterized protein PtA15_14A125 [Puccinia triticina]WAQ91243.1 hypothetical protein PtA15_14A125 [Puccinia triticina]